MGASKGFTFTLLALRKSEGSNVEGRRPAPRFPIRPISAHPASLRSALFRVFVGAGLQPGIFAFAVASLQNGLSL
jgi:hypothetical protein